MDIVAFQLAENLFHELSPMSPSEREPLLAALKQKDPEIAEFVEELLHTSSESDFLETPANWFGDLDFKHGEVVDDFEIVSTLGQGSFGTVYLARQLSLDRLVALKSSPDLGEEGRTMAPMDHQGIVKIFSQKKLGDTGSRLLCMQYVPGLPLDRLIPLLKKEKDFAHWGRSILRILDEATRHQHVDYKVDNRKLEELEDFDAVDWVLWLGASLCRALEHAHERNVLHLDVKPGNILVHLSGRPLLSDFNVSVKTQDESKHSMKILGGTLRYMSPEQRILLEEPERAKRESPSVGPSSDLYSLGMVLQDLWEFVEAHPATNPEIRGTEIEAQQIFQRMTTENPNERFRSGGEAADRLEACLARRNVVENLPPMGWARRWQARYPVFFFLMLPLFPQFLGSIVNITYNEIRIVQALSTDQRKAFINLVFYYNVVLYPLCVALAFYFSRGLGRPLFDRHFDWEPIRDELCLEVTRLPVRILGVVTLGWIPGALFFPLGIDWLAGPIPVQVYWHFFASFTLSWLLAMTYCFLHVQTFNIRVLYPRFLVGIKDIHARARRDLRVVGVRLRLFHVLAVISPIVAALVVVWSGAAPTLGHSLQLLKFLLTFLLFAAGVGFFSTFFGSEELSQLLFALTGRAKYKGRRLKS